MARRARTTTNGRADRPVMLSCRGVGVSFGGLAALDGVDLDVRENEIVGLIGPNGAGKTTLMDCISGFRPVRAGRIEHRGTDLLARSPGQRAALGIGRTLQNVRLFPYLTVLDCLRVALHRHADGGALTAAFRLPPTPSEEQGLLERASALIELVGLTRYAESWASELSYGTLRLLELACMLALEPELLLLDEPTSGISQKESEALGPLLRNIKEQTGATFLVIEHDIPLVMGLSDWVYVLDAGRLLAEGTPEEVRTDPGVIEAYLGTRWDGRRRKRATAATTEAPSSPEPRRPLRSTARRRPSTGETLLELSGVDVAYGRVQVLYGVNLVVRRGERVALLGTNGAGKSTILRAASGLVPTRRGSITWKGTDIGSLRAEDLVRQGLGHVPGGRGLFPSLTVEENLRMGGYIHDDPARVTEEIDRAVGLFPWLTDRLGQPAGTLSGGEQQQLATARALMARPDVLMIDELSLGLAPLVIERLLDTVQRLHEEEGLTVVLVEQQATMALAYTDRAYFLEKGEVRYEGPSSGLAARPDLLRSVFLSGAAEGFAARTAPAPQGAKARPLRRTR